jgi:predicted ribosome quality control (RQC) complex YloA/Tae2 family protein
MENINNIIQETINDYINDIIIEGVINEISKKEKQEKKAIKRLHKDINDASKKGKKKAKKNVEKAKEIAKNAKKLRRGLRTDFNVKQDRETNPNLNNQDAEDLNDILDSDLIDVAALAKRVYPNHTPQGAQSQLRKKIKGLKSDSGSTYRLKKKEAFKIRRELAKEI